MRAASRALYVEVKRQTGSGCSYALATIFEWTSGTISTVSRCVSSYIRRDRGLRAGRQSDGGDRYARRRGNEWVVDANEAATARCQRREEREEA